MIRFTLSCGFVFLFYSSLNGDITLFIAWPVSRGIPSRPPPVFVNITWACLTNNTSSSSRQTLQKDWTRPLWCGIICVMRYYNTSDCSSSKIWGYMMMRFCCQEGGSPCCPGVPTLLWQHLQSNTASMQLIQSTVNIIMSADWSAFGTDWLIWGCSCCVAVFRLHSIGYFFFWNFKHV